MTKKEVIEKLRELEMWFDGFICCASSEYDSMAGELPYNINGEHTYSVTKAIELLGKKDE